MYPSGIKTNLSRRRWLAQLGAMAALAAAAPFSESLSAATAAKSFRFIIANDLHYLDEESGKWLEGAARKMKEEKPAFCLLAGDLTENGGEADLKAVREIFSTVGCPIHVVPGNHDCHKERDTKDFEAVFPGQLNYSFEHEGWQWIGLDTTNGTLYQKISIKKTTLDWLDANLPKLNPARPTVIFTHFPLGPGVTYRPTNADDLLARFSKFNLKAIFCGHFHGYTEKPVLNTVAYTGRCCALKRNNHDKTKEKGFMVGTTEPGKITLRFVEMAG